MTSPQQALTGSRVQTILQTGKRRVRINRSSFSRKQGFSLIELLLVTIIIAAIAGLSTPIFKNTYEDVRFSAIARDIAACLSLCYEKAVCENRAYRFAIDGKESSCRILVEDKDEKGAEKKFIPLNESWARAVKLPDGIEAEEESAHLTFYPSGIVEGGPISVKNRQGSQKVIKIDQRTGRIGIEDVKKE